MDTDTLIARVRIAAITSREPPKTRLSSRLGSYSQMAVAFSTAAIFVMCPISDHVDVPEVNDMSQTSGVEMEDYLEGKIQI